MTGWNKAIGLRWHGRTLWADWLVGPGYNPDITNITNLILIHIIYIIYAIHTIYTYNIYIQLSK